MHTKHLLIGALMLCPLPPSSYAATEGQKVDINVTQDAIFVTDVATSLSSVVSRAILEQIEQECSPLKSATHVDVHVQLDRWTDGDTQSVSISGSAVCSNN